MNWKKPKQRQRNSLITTQEFNTHNTTREDTRGKTFAPFLFMSKAVRKGKRNNNPTNTKSQATKPRKQDKKQESRQGRKPSRRAGQEDKRRKRKANEKIT